MVVSRCSRWVSTWSCMPENHDTLASSCTTCHESDCTQLISLGGGAHYKSNTNNSHSLDAFHSYMFLFYFTHLSYSWVALFIATISLKMQLSNSYTSLQIVVTTSWSNVLCFSLVLPLYRRLCPQCLFLILIVFLNVCLVEVIEKWKDKKWL